MKCECNLCGAIISPLEWEDNNGMCNGCADDLVTAEQELQKE